MANFDSIINVDEWISDYYLTTDEKGSSFDKRVADAVKQWKAEDKELGISPWSRLTGAREQLELQLATLGAVADAAQLAAVYEGIESAFGYAAPAEQRLQRAEAELVFTAAADPKRSMFVLRARQMESPEDLAATMPLASDEAPMTLDGKPLNTTIYKLVGEIFLAETPPEFVVILAGEWAVLAERESWPLGRHLVVNVATAIANNDKRAHGELAYVTAILAAEHTQPAADGTTWWHATIEEARNHTVKVSEELRGAIKASIEIIGNDVLERHRQQDLPIHDLDGNELAAQALRYLYRILFLLFAESSPELEILPTGDEDYESGYGLSRLRDQILTEPVTQRAQRGTHLYDSLQLLFRLVNDGHDTTGLTFRNLEADLFAPTATPYIDQVKLSNLALHRVLQNLLLTKEKRGSDRGFISYATLGVTELGQVYEGLMSYTGFIAQEDLLEVAKNGDATKGSWVVPVSQAEDLPAGSVVMDTLPNGSTKRREHRRGSFVYRQSSRDRERSASFYTPPVITEFTVGQAIEELEATGRIASADDILALTICEPAMGSGAFAVEAVNQLAELYLVKKEAETGTQIPGDQRARELQKVKAYIALHQVYGVDLNKTAVELAEISLWLNTMTADLKAPWFGLHLRHGNSLVGATRSTFAVKDLKTKAYLKATPTHHSLIGLQDAITNVATGSNGTHNTEITVKSRVHHFLVPATGWGAAADAKDLKGIADEDIKAMKKWRSAVRKGLTSKQIAKAQDLSAQVERLWQFALVRNQIAEDQIRRDLDLFGQPRTAPTATNVTRATVEAELLRNPDSTYNRLRLAMDAWNALWYWPITATDELPDLDEYLDTLTDLLGTPFSATKRPQGHQEFGADLDWHELDYVEDLNKKASQAKNVADVLATHPWLATAQQVAKDQAFFHWDLDFATVMAKGGFDFQVGNPPWVRPRTDVDALLSEHDPWFNLAHKPTQEQKNQRRARLANDDAALATLTTGIAESVVTSAVLGDAARYPHLQGQQPDLYRGFMERTWANANSNGIISLIHPESHFTEKKAAPLRAGAYLRLRRHWQFINELELFDIHHLVKYGVHIYGAKKSSPYFLAASSLYHPKTVIDSFAHDGSGKLPGLKDDNNNWDLRPHKDRIITVDEDMLRTWKSILEDPDTPLLHTRTVYSVNSEAAAVLAKLAEAPRMRELGLQYSAGWHETADKKAGYFDSSWQHPDTWADVILQGPHLGVSTPMIKQPNPTMKHNQDWSEVDLEAMPEDFIPATAYMRNLEKVAYADDYGTWNQNSDAHRVIDQYRVVWRRMAATTGFRTIYPTIIPPGSAHVNTVESGSNTDNLAMTVAFGANLSSFVVDFSVRSMNPSDLFPSTIGGLPFGVWKTTKIHENYLRLNCLTSAYAELWEEVMGSEWTVDVPLRNARDRWHAQNEIDAMVALSLGVSLPELLMIYRTQFPVMRRYDQEDLYDARGRKVPKPVLDAHKKVRGEPMLGVDARTWVHPQSGVSYEFVYPFAPLDREADLSEAYAKYQEMM